MLVEPSPKLQFQWLMALPALSVPAELKLTVSGARPLVGLAVNKTQGGLGHREWTAPLPKSEAVALGGLEAGRKIARIGVSVRWILRGAGGPIAKIPVPTRDGIAEVVSPRRSEIHRERRRAGGWAGRELEGDRTQREHRAIAPAAAPSAVPYRVLPDKTNPPIGYAPSLLTPEFPFAEK